MKIVSSGDHTCLFASYPKVFWNVRHEGLSPGQEAGLCVFDLFNKRKGLLKGFSFFLLPSRVSRYSLSLP